MSSLANPSVVSDERDASIPMSIAEIELIEALRRTRWPHTDTHAALNEDETVVHMIWQTLGALFDAIARRSGAEHPRLTAPSLAYLEEHWRSSEPMAVPADPAATAALERLHEEFRHIPDCIIRLCRTDDADAPAFAQAIGYLNLITAE